MTDPLPMLTVERLRDGGYVVIDGIGRSYEGYRQPVFASAEIAEVLKYLKTKLEPPKTVAK